MPLSIYMCSAVRYTLKCSENFFGAKVMTTATSAVKIRRTDCRTAVTTLHSPYGLLTRHNSYMWKTTNTHTYDCTWLKTKTISFVVFTLSVHSASIRGDDQYLHQSLTTTHCRVNEQHCVPIETPSRMIVWTYSKNDTSLFRTLGIFSIKQVDNYILIPNLGIGGGNIEKNDNLLLL